MPVYRSRYIHLDKTAHLATLAYVAEPVDARILAFFGRKRNWCPGGSEGMLLAAGSTYSNTFRKKERDCQRRQRRGYLLEKGSTKKGILPMSNESVSSQEPAWPKEKHPLQVLEQTVQTGVVQPEGVRAGPPWSVGTTIVWRSCGALCAAGTRNGRCDG
jgi:hypothetical protein